jgi:ABC-2 type transport system permease protein
VRDPRYAQSLITIPLIPALIFFYAGAVDALGVLLWVGPIVALLLSMSIYTDVSYDNTAFALHLQKGVRGVDDRIGRVVGLAVFAVPVSLVIVVASVAVVGQWDWLVGILAVTIGVLLSGFAVSSILSGWLTFPVPAPGESPFKSRPGGGFGLLISTLGSWAVLGILVVPELALAIVGFATGAVLFGWLALVVALVLGGALLVIGVRVGGRILDARGPALLVQLQNQK